MRNRPSFEIDNSGFPPSCLPTDLDKTNLVDITAVGDQWRKYLDKETGKIHDGAEYYRQSQEQTGETGQAQPRGAATRRRIG